MIKTKQPCELNLVLRIGVDSVNADPVVSEVTFVKTVDIDSGAAHQRIRSGPASQFVVASIPVQNILIGAALMVSLPANKAARNPASLYVDA